MNSGTLLNENLGDATPTCPPPEKRVRPHADPLPSTSPAGAPAAESRPSVSALAIHDLIVLGLWRVNARAERIRGLGRCYSQIRAELTAARVELIRLYEKLVEIEEFRVEDHRLDSEPGPEVVVPLEVNRG